MRSGGDECHSVSSHSGARDSATPESITTIESMDTGPAPRGASRNDDPGMLRTPLPLGEVKWMQPLLPLDARRHRAHRVALAEQRAGAGDDDVAFLQAVADFDLACRHQPALDPPRLAPPPPP